VLNRIDIGRGSKAITVFPTLDRQLIVASSVVLDFEAIIVYPNLARL
jgi:hypothetical protein